MMIRTLNRRKLLALVLSISLLLTGCWDRIEINDIAIVLAIAVDKEKDGNIRVSLEIPLASQLGGTQGGGGGTGGSGRADYIDSEIAPTFVQAYAQLQDRMSRRLKFGHYRVLIIGEEMARSGIEDVFDIVARRPENRLSSYMIVAKGTAESLMKSQPKLERFSGEAIREMVKQGEIVPTNVKNTAMSLSHYGSDAVLPYMGVKKLKEKDSKGTEEIELLGYAQFLEDRMVDVMARESAMGLSWLKNNIRPITVVVNLNKPENLIFTVIRSNAKIEPIVEQDGRLRFDIRIDARLRLNENKSKEDLTNRLVMEKVKKHASDDIRLQVMDTIRLIQKSGADSAELGLKLFRKDPITWKKLEPNWRELLKEAEFDVKVKADISEFGLISENIVRGG